ncbi:unnamed protein product [Onchocerca flexuosa]|uniref:Ovule protein n=1 Tax=Onchocerca flexuosa TaxID=387005 RepID=A0A183HZI2_9BILA|nr:unnamed protein product [Onchocerca flexuosa]
MSMCWPGFDPVGSYGATSNYSHQPGTCPTLSMTIAKQNDQQIAHQFHPCNFVTFAQHFSTLSFNTNNTPSLLWPSTSTKKKPTPVPENLKDEVNTFHKKVCLILHLLIYNTTLPYQFV